MALQRDKIVGNAEKLVARGKIEPAIREYERLLDENPNDVNTLNRIGDLWVRIERTDEAVKVFRKIADHYARDGFFLKAIAIFKKINKLDPSKLDIYAKLAELYAKQGLAMEAKSQYMVLADYYVKHGDLESATGIYLKIAELDPHSVNVRIKLADLYTQNNQTPQALQEYDRVGRMLLKRGMSSEALQVFKKAQKIDSGNIDLAESTVSALLDEKEYAGAIEIVQSALESNRENARLIILMSGIHIAKDDTSSAREVLEQGLSSNPSDFGVRLALADLQLNSGDSDSAVELVTPILSVAAGTPDETRAVMLLERVAAVHPDHPAALEKLVEVYRRLDDSSNAIEAMTRLGNAHMERREYQQAEAIFRDLARRDPDNPGHRDRLAELAQETGSSMPAIPLAEPPDEESDTLLDFSEDVIEETQAPIPEDALPEELPVTPAETWEPEELEEETIDLEFPEEIVETEESAPAASALLSEEEQQAQNELLEFITEHLTEADVFAKYGLFDKAIEHLQTVIEKSPRHRVAYEKLLNVYLNEGQAEQIRETANRYIALLRIEGDIDGAEAFEQNIWNRGYATGPAVKEAEVTQAPVEAIEEILPEELAPVDPVDETPVTAAAATEELTLPPEISDDEFEDIVSEDLSVVAPSDAPLPEETLVAESEAVVESETIESIELEAGEDTPMVLEEEPSSVVEPAVEPRPTPEVPSDETPEFADLPEVEAEDEEPLGPAIEEPIAVQELLVEASETPEPDPFDDPGLSGAFQGDFPLSPSMEDLGELDFYIEQELLEEAGNKLETLSAQFPMHPEILVREESLHSARVRIAGTLKAYEHVELDKQTTPAPPVQADAGNDSMAALPDEVSFDPAALDELSVLPEPLTDDEQDLFAGEDDFFDLAAELGEDLADEEAELSEIADDEQSLEQIFREFKKGVEQQLDSEDYDTHYNLGIAYKEMGLIDEAIGEFQLASKDPHRAIDGCSMLGLCFLEKGMPQLAIKWYNKGLEMPEISEEEHMGLLYDLGAAYLEVGDIDAAHKAFIEVYGINSKYRDIVARIKQLEDVRRAT